MRFSQSTHLLMCLSLETLINVYHKDWLTYSGGTDRPGEFCYNFSDLTQMIISPTRIPDCDSHSPTLLDSFISFNASICSTMAFHQVVVSVSIDFSTNSKRYTPVYITVWLFSCWLGWSSYIIWEMFHERISRNSVLLQLLANFVGRFRLELMYISLIISIRSNFTHGFQLLVHLP